MTTDDFFLFVSHVSEDRAAALQVVDELERRAIRCWIAPRDVGAGKPFDDEIAQAIDTSRALLLIFSEHCNDSAYIRREVTVAGNAHKLIIPFRIENAVPTKGLAVRLADLHWIDGFVARERAIDEVLRTVRPPEKQDDESAPKVAQRLAAEIPKKGQECPDQAPDAKLRKEETRKKEDAQASPATVETSARTLPSSTGLQIVSGLLVFQALLRAGVAIYLLNTFAKPDEYRIFFAFTLMWFALSAVTIAIALGIARRRQWARVFGLTICGIGTLHDAFFVLVLLVSYADANPRAKLFQLILGTSSTLYLVVYIVSLICLYRGYRGLPRTA